MSLSATPLTYPATLLYISELALVAVTEGDVTQAWYEAFTAHMVEEHGLEDSELPTAETTDLVDMYREWLMSESEESYQLMDALTAYDYEDVYARTLAYLQARTLPHLQARALDPSVPSRRVMTTCPAA